MGIIQQNLTARIRSWEQEELSLRAVYKVSTGLTIACTMDRSSSTLSFHMAVLSSCGKSVPNAATHPYSGQGLCERMGVCTPELHGYQRWVRCGLSPSFRCSTEHCALVTHTRSAHTETCRVAVLSVGCLKPAEEEGHEQGNDAEAAHWDCLETARARRPYGCIVGPGYGCRGSPTSQAATAVEKKA